MVKWLFFVFVNFIVNFSNAQNLENCYDVVYDLVHDSDYFQSKVKDLQNNKLAKDVRLALLIDAAPIENKEMEISYDENYSIILYESHPDHFVNLAQFYFDPKKGKLYLQNKETNRLRETKYPKRKFSNLPDSCK